MKNTIWGAGLATQTAQASPSECVTTLGETTVVVIDSRAAGDASLADVGPERSLATLVRLAPVKARAQEGTIETEVTYVDSFGNLRLAGGADELAADGLVVQLARGF